MARRLDRKQCQQIDYYIEDWSIPSKKVKIQKEKNNHNIQGGNDRSGSSVRAPADIPELCEGIVSCSLDTDNHRVRPSTSFFLLAHLCHKHDRDFRVLFRLVAKD